MCILVKDMRQRRFVEETRAQKKQRELKELEIITFGQFTIKECISKLMHKTIKMLQNKLGSSLTSTLTQDVFD